MDEAVSDLHTQRERQQLEIYNIMSQVFVILFCSVRFFVWVSPLLLIEILVRTCFRHELEVLLPFGQSFPLFMLGEFRFQKPLGPSRHQPGSISRAFATFSCLGWPK